MRVRVRVRVQAMGVPLPPKVVTSIFAEIDDNGSGTIDFKEFVRYVFPRGDQGSGAGSEDWQRLGAATLAARRSQRLEKTLGLIRKPAILQVRACTRACACVRVVLPHPFVVAFLPAYVSAGLLAACVCDGEWNELHWL